MSNSLQKEREDSYIRKCISLIESILGWGANDGWTHYDFEKLSEVIHNATGVRLSVTTLKRIWGKLTYNSAPTLTTLNTLARFAGYDDWRTFKQNTDVQQGPPEATMTIPSESSTTPIREDNGKIKSYYWLAALVSLLILVYFMIPKKELPSRVIQVRKTANPDQFEFKANKIKTEGVPNSVVFHYDARAARTDSVFIVQTWDIRRKKQVSKNKHAHSAMYYYPGFFRAKLIADGQTVKTHDLWITSDGWLCLAENEPTPIYFKKEECVKDNVVSIDANTLKTYNLSLHPHAPRIRMFNQRDFGDLMSDNFVFETKIKNPFNDGASACQFVQVLVQCKNDIIIIPLAAQACIGDLRLAFCGYEINSADADLSKFGCDLMQWTSLRIETVNKNATIYVNDVKAHSLTFPNVPSDIVGVQVRFSGIGAVKDTWFKHNGVTMHLK